jgi:hypothetical protein
MRVMGGKTSTPIDLDEVRVWRNKDPLLRHTKLDPANVSHGEIEHARVSELHEGKPLVFGMRTTDGGRLVGGWIFDPTDTESMLKEAGVQSVRELNGRKVTVIRNEGRGDAAAIIFP